MQMRSAMIDKDVAASSLVDDSLPWKMVWRVKFLEGSAVRSQEVYDTEDDAWDAAGEYVSGTVSV
jgi:hypothetical protein